MNVRNTGGFRAANGSIDPEKMEIQPLGRTMRLVEEGSAIGEILS